MGIPAFYGLSSSSGAILIWEMVLGTTGWSRKTRCLGRSRGTCCEPGLDHATPSGPLVGAANGWVGKTAKLMLLSDVPTCSRVTSVSKGNLAPA